MMRKPTHPGEVFLEDVLKPLDISLSDAAAMLGVAKSTLYELVKCRSSLSPSMALRIAVATGTTPESWLAMQSKLDLWRATQSTAIHVAPKCLAG